MGFSKARTLEWIAMPSSRGPSPPRDHTQVSCTADGHLSQGGLLDTSLTASFSGVTGLSLPLCGGWAVVQPPRLSQKKGTGPVYRPLWTRLGDVPCIPYGQCESQHCRGVGPGLSSGEITAAEQEMWTIYGSRGQNITRKG